MKNSSFFPKLLKDSPLNNAAHDLYTVLKISQSIISLFSNLKLIQSTQSFLY